MKVCATAGNFWRGGSAAGANKLRDKIGEFAAPTLQHMREMCHGCNHLQGWVPKSSGGMPGPGMNPDSLIIKNLFAGTSASALVISLGALKRLPE